MRQIFTARNEVGARLCLPPANEVCEGYVLTGVCLSTMGGCAWLLGGCVVARGRGACVVALRGACMVAPGGMLGCLGVCAWLLGGCAWLLWGGCMVATGGHAWFFPEGGMCGFVLGVCMVFSRGCIGYDEIQSMSGWYASYWNAFLFSQACVILFTGGSVSVHAGIPPPGAGTPPAACTPLGAAPRE